MEMILSFHAAGSMKSAASETAKCGTEAAFTMKRSKKYFSLFQKPDENWNILSKWPGNPVLYFLFRSVKMKKYGTCWSIGICFLEL